MVSSCVIVDDSARFLELARALLERDGIKVVGTAGSAEEGLSCVVERRPDVALVDIDLGQDDGFDLLRDLEGETAVILISAHAEDDFGDLIHASSALGFIPKTELSASAVHDLVDGNGAL